jgi:SHS2 domain-containing protein
VGRGRSTLQERARTDLDPSHPGSRQGAHTNTMHQRAETGEHVGEWKVIVSGRRLEDVFEATARVIANATGRTSDEDPAAWESIDITARDVPTLLVDWANELLGRSEVTGLAYAELRSVRVVQLPGGSARASAQLRGKRVTQWTSQLKAATYHALLLEKRGNEWHAEVLFDV